MVNLIDGFTPYAGEDAEKYNRLRWWPGLTFGDILDRAADMFADKMAFVDGGYTSPPVQVRGFSPRMVKRMIREASAKTSAYLGSVG